MLENVLERLDTTESTTLALKREDGGKIRVASLLWEGPKAISQRQGNRGVTGFAVKHSEKWDYDQWDSKS